MSDALDAQSVITRDMLMLVARNQLEALETTQYQIAVDQMTGPQTLPAEIAQYQRIDTPERVERLLPRCDRAIRFMQDRGRLPPVDAAIEVDRYTIWPGQALSYKIGQREIERARRAVTDEAGPGFDLRVFHDQLLVHGSVPLETPRRELPGWYRAAIAAEVDQRAQGS
ncbi:MAG: DUF885 family protein [Candidatus Limnocylindria bacterium]